MYEIFIALLNKSKKKAADVSRATGIPSSTFSDWKKGKSSPKQDKLQKIADFFGVSIDYLMTGKEPLEENSEMCGYIACAKELSEMGIGLQELRDLIDTVKKLKKKD